MARTILNVADGATANSSDAVLLARANHTGTQAAGTITGLAAVATSGSAADLSAGILPAARFDDTAHGARAGGTLHANVVAAGAAGFMTGADKTKLDGVATGATANSSDATLLARANHTGTQIASTISDFSEAVDDRVAALLIAGSGVTLTYNDAANTLTVAATGASGVTTVNFGAFPGASDASVTITGQTGIVAGSSVIATIQATATADHTADEHVAETISIAAGNIVAGTGFTIYAVNTSQLNEPLEQNKGRFSTGIAGGDGQPQGLQIPMAGGRGTRLYGQFTVTWRWS